MRSLIKNSIFTLSKYLGLFAIARMLLKYKVRVLCYHGFTTIDEHLNVPGLFIEPSAFAERMRYLQRKGYNVISLDEAYENISKGIKQKTASLLLLMMVMSVCYEKLRLY